MTPAQSDEFTPSREQLAEEYAALRQDIQHIAGRVDTIRTFGVGAVGAVLILAIQQGLAVIALGGAALAQCFALIDLTGAYRYTTFAGRARRIELALDAYDDHERAGDDHSHALVLNRIDNLEKRPFQLELNEPGTHEMAFIYPRAVFRILYPALIAAGGVLAIGLQWREGPGLAVAGVVALVLTLWCLCVPSYLDPTKPPLLWWFGRRRLRSVWMGWTAAVVDVLLLAGAVALLWPAVQSPPAQRPGILSIATSPAVRSVEARFDVRPSCSSVRAKLVIQAEGPARTAVVRLPANLRPRHLPASATITVAVTNGSARLSIDGMPSEERGGRCTFAIPALVGTGAVDRAVVMTHMTPSTQFSTEDAVGYSRAPAQVATCTAFATGAPTLTCSALLRLEDADSDRKRLAQFGLSAALVLAALLVAGCWLIRGSRRAA